jgi:predicted amidohydrolase
MLLPQNRRLFLLTTLLFLCCPAALLAKGNEPVKTIVHFSDFTQEKASGGWTVWSPRAEIAPRFSIDDEAGRTKSGSLRIESGDNPAALGSWRRRVGDIVGGKTYRFTAYYRTRNVAHSGHRVFAQLGWLDEKGQRLRLPDIAADAGASGEWTRAECVATAPNEARGVEIELNLAWAPGGAVWWDDITLAEEGAAPRRTVRALTVYHRPQNTRDAAKSVAEFCRVAEAASDQKPDIICLPEGITVIGTGKTYADVSEPIPGPTTRTLGALAKKMHSYLVAGIIERDEATIYNTAVLVGRNGELVGKYRKTHLPQAEVEGGLTPGNDYPVFRTDFGKVGLLVCWDVQFPEPARALALAGAEMILLPIWGGSETLARARAIENHVFLVTSSYDMKTFIVDPTGEVRAEATREKPVALAELDLEKRIVQPWLGDMKTRTWKERRGDLPVETSR